MSFSVNVSLHLCWISWHRAVVRGPSMRKRLGPAVTLTLILMQPSGLDSIVSQKLKGGAQERSAFCLLHLLSVINCRVTLTKSDFPYNPTQNQQSSEESVLHVCVRAGPTGVGLNELKKKLLISDPQHFSVTIPRKSRVISPH